MLFEQAPGLLEARALLQHVQRERSIHGSPADVGAQEMLDVIGGVLQEYAAHFYELEADRMAEQAQASARKQQPTPSRRLLTDRPKFPNGMAFLVDGRTAPLDAAYDKAKRWLSDLLSEVSDDSQ
jgi:hypothetical protein